MPDEPTRSPTGDDRGRSGEEPDRSPQGAGRAGAAVERPLPLSQLVGRVVLGLIAVLFVIFAVFNRQPVDFDWVFGQTEVVEQGGEYVGGGVPLIVLLIGSFVLGAIVGAGLLWRRRRHARRRDDGPSVS